jgi:AcrR family transcriptional regulator
MTPPVKQPDPDGSQPGGADFPWAAHRLTGEDVAGAQRDLLVDAVAEVLAERGYSGLTIERISTAAGVSRGVFYGNFSNKQEAVEVSHGIVADRFFALLDEACKAQDRWPLKAKVAIGAALDFAAAAPAQAQLLALDCVAFNLQISRRTIEPRDRLAAMLASGRRHSESGAALPSLTEQGLVGAFWGIVAARLMNGEAVRLPELAPQLVELTLAPYLGPAAAAEVATRPRIRPQPRPAEP